MTGRTALWTGLAMVAFAANSVLCRLALGPEAIDAASFTTVRLGSGAVTLLLLAAVSGKKRAVPAGSWASAGLLFAYAIAFSFAYTMLSTGTGALILFGAVQLTMILSALRSGERPHPLQWVGLAVALAGLVGLVLPGLTAPSPLGSAFMFVAGVGWGLYSLRGRGSQDPLAETGRNFLLSVPPAVVVSLIAFGRMHLSTEGILFAVASGALASGVGYVIWYAALRGLSATRAATVQLSVPVIAALGGVVFLAEQVTPRLIVCTVLILGGVALALAGRERIGAPR